MFKMSSAVCNAGCQSLAPFTDCIVSHFLVQTVLFLLNTLAQIFHFRDPVVLVHTRVGSPTPRSRRGSVLTVRRPRYLSYQDCKPRAADRYPNNVRRCQ